MCSITFTIVDIIICLQIKRSLLEYLHNGKNLICVRRNGAEKILEFPFIWQRWTRRLVADLDWKLGLILCLGRSSIFSGGDYHHLGLFCFWRRNIPSVTSSVATVHRKTWGGHEFVASELPTGEPSLSLTCTWLDTLMYTKDLHLMIKRHWSSMFYYGHIARTCISNYSAKICPITSHVESSEHQNILSIILNSKFAQFSSFTDRKQKLSTSLWSAASYLRNLEEAKEVGKLNGHRTGLSSNDSNDVVKRPISICWYRAIRTDELALRFEEIVPCNEAYNFNNLIRVSLQ